MDILTATPETGPVDTGVSIEDVMSEFDTPAPAEAIDEITEEMVAEAETEGDPETDPENEGDETEAEVETEDSEEAPQNVYKVKVNGEEIDVPLNELLNGYSRTQDYKAKTAEVAEQKRAVEAERAGMATEYVSELKRATDLFEAADPVLREARATNWEHLKATDPAYYGQLRAAVDDRVAILNAERKRIAGVETELAQRTAQEAAAERQTEIDMLMTAIPEIQDPVKQQAFAKDTNEYLASMGFSAEDVAEIGDHRAFVIVDKARRYDAMMKAKSSLPAKKVVTVSDVKALKTDATSSRSTPNRLSPNASRDQKADYVLAQLLEE